MSQERAALSPLLQQSSNILAVRGEGMYVFDEDDRAWLDFTSGIGVLSTGHCHPRVVEAAREQAGKLVHGQYAIVRHPPMLELSEKLASVMPSGVDRVVFSNAGTEAIEAAIRLARLLVELMPEEPEAAGLLALMLLHHARRDARVRDGRLVLLEDQDRRLWDADAIAEGSALVEGALRRGRVGSYQIQAAIAAVHCQASTPEETDWKQIVGLYSVLVRIHPTPVVRLNRAVAVAMDGELSLGLELLDELADEPTLKRYHPYHAARADLLRRSRRLDEAASAYAAALRVCSNPVEEDYLERRLAELDG